jgi:hypothetical protein
MAAPPSPATAALPFPIHETHPEFTRSLLPGDVLVYSRSGVFNKIISIKTWSRFTHVEVAIPVVPDAPSLTVAARNGEGCGVYAFNPDGLALVMRPLPHFPFDLTQAMQWFRTERVQEQGYDWLGLLNFAYARRVSRNNGKMFCSELAIRFLREGGCDLIPGEDADTISPRDLTVNQRLYVAWRSAAEWARHQEQQTYAEKGW